MDLTYNDIIQSLFANGVEQYIPDGMAHSYPIIGKENNQIVDCFFIYGYVPNRGEFYPPTGRIALNPKSKKLLFYYSSDEKPFLSNKEINVYQIISDHTKEERRDASLRYPDSYMKIREFAFCDSLSIEQKKILSEYQTIFSIIIPANQVVFYEALSPSFFEWMNNVLT